MKSDTTLDELMLDAAAVVIPGRRLRAFVAGGRWHVQDVDAPWETWAVIERDGSFVFERE